MLQAFDTTYSTLIVFYVAARLVIAGTYIQFGYFLKHVRAIMALNMLMILCPTIIWIGSIFVDGGTRLALIWIAIVWGEYSLLAPPLSR
jgi:low temperature requirement protein LtrA